MLLSLNNVRPEEKHVNIIIARIEQKKNIHLNVYRCGITISSVRKVRKKFG